jgi:hypothetical protein
MVERGWGAVFALGTIAFLAFLWILIVSSLLAWQRQPRLQAGRVGAV